MTKKTASILVLGQVRIAEALIAAETAEFRQFQDLNPSNA
jgi:hypothetical protein